MLDRGGRLDAVRRGIRIAAQGARRNPDAEQGDGRYRNRPAVLLRSPADGTLWHGFLPKTWF